MLAVFRARVIAAPVAMLLAFSTVAVATLGLWQSAAAQVPSPIDRGAAEARQFRGNLQPDPFSLGTADGASNVTLLPGSQRQTSINASELFPGSGTIRPGDVSAQFSNPVALEAMGHANRSALEAQQSPTGEAYRTVIDTRRLAPPDLREDPVFRTTRQTLGALDDISRNFADCSVERTFAPGNMQARISDIRTCERVLDQSATLSIRHDYSAGVLSLRSGIGAVVSCGHDCIDVWIGRIGDNYWSGYCSIFEERVTFHVDNPAAITSAVIEHAKWDDHIQIHVRGSKVWNGPYEDFPPETGNPEEFMPCELGRNWEVNPNVDVTGALRAGGDVEFRIRVSVTGRGEGYARMRIRFDPSRLVYSDVWTSSQNVARLGMVDPGFCTASVSCADMPPLDGNGCANIEGNTVCPWQLPSHESGFMSRFVNPLCRRVVANISCEFSRGPMECFFDAQSRVQCPSNSGPVVDTCAPLRTNPSCAFVRTSCVDGARAASGTCYVQEDVYDCGFTANIPTVNVGTAVSCPGPIRCMGGDCVDFNHESNPNFAQAAAALQGLSLMASDGNCDPASGQCALFAGNAQTCKRAVGGLVNCCEQPGGVSLGDYLRLIMAVRNVDAAMMSLDTANQMRGAWELLRNPITSAWGVADSAFTSAWNSVSGSTVAAASDAAAAGLMGQAQQFMLRQTVEWTASAFGPQATNMLFSVVNGSEILPAVDVATGTVTQGTLQLGGGAAVVGSVLSWAMAAYAVYQIFTVLVQIIWACERREFELAVQRQLRSCHHVGSFCASRVLGMCIERRESHCCFASPLSRILQQQMRPQLGRGWGSPRNPDCAGITVAQMSAVDWSRVDLTEWVGILASEGMLPDAASITIDRLTGTGRRALDGADPAAARLGAIQRSQQRLAPLDVQGRRNQAIEELRSSQGLP